MTTTEIRDTSPNPATAKLSLHPEPKKTPPVRIWALVGAVFLSIEGYALAMWFLSGDAKSTPAGPTPIPGWMKVATHGFEVVGVLGFIGFFSWFVVRPWVRERRLTQDSLFCLVFWSLFWHDTLTNYLVHYTTYNAAFINLGSWDRHILGWSSHNGNKVIEPAIFVCTAYMWVVFGGVLIGTIVMRKARQRWPEMSNLGLVAVIVGFFVVFDLFVEGSFMRLGFWTYPGAIRSLTIFPGHYYQFPLYEPLMFGPTWAGFTCLRYFKNDRGESAVERGSSELRASGRTTLLRFLALAGAANLIFVAFYDLPVNIVALHGSAWPKDISSRSYLTDNLCGAGTTHACPGPKIPFPHGDSDHVDPEGRLVSGGGR